MQLYRALGLSQAFKIGFAPQAPAAFAKALEISEELGDVDAQAEALWGLWVAQVGMGEYRASLGNAERFVAVAQSGLDRFIGDTHAQHDTVLHGGLPGCPPSRRSHAGPRYLG